MNVSDRLLSLLLFSVAIVFLAACRQAPQPLDDGMPARSVGGAESVYEVRGRHVEIGGDAVGANASESASSIESTDESLYGVAMTWANQDGRPVELASFAGRPVVLSMVFTNCSYACPLIIRDMKRIGVRLPDDVRDDVQFVLVSLDPERDRPEVLRRFAEGYGLDLDRWTLLRGDGEQVRLLAALLGVRYREQSDGRFAHTNLIAILDEAGEIIHQQARLGGDGASGARMFTNR